MSEQVRDRAMLKQMQDLPLELKIRLTQDRIREWYEHWDGEVSVSFSGGKDSTVLLDIAREMYPDIEAVFVDTGLEYPEIRKFVQTFDNVTWLKPEMRFDEVITRYGYPIIGKEISLKLHYLKQGSEWGKRCAQNGGRYGIAKYVDIAKEPFNVSDRCCGVMKKRPAHAYQKRSGKRFITAQMAAESQLREQIWLQNGCNAFDTRNPVSNPMSFWTEQDILLYIKQKNLPIASVYGDIVYDRDEPYQERFDGYVTTKLTTTGCKRTGCIFCAFGAHLEKQSRFVRLRETHPKLYNYCINGGEFDENGVWIPNRQGLGMGYVFDRLNELYGKDGKPFIEY